MIFFSSRMCLLLTENISNVYFEQNKNQESLIYVKEISDLSLQRFAHSGIIYNFNYKCL